MIHCLWMAHARIDISGQRFGALVVLYRDGRIGRHAAWRCKCDCGVYVNVTGSWLRRGVKKACGINGHSWAKICASKRGIADSKRPEHNVWERMIDRCTNEKHHKFESYGGRGITVCERWMSFKSFFLDMGSRPTPEHTIERKNNDGNYDPDNCVWATKKEQNRNKRNTLFVEYDGERIKLIELMERFSISYANVVSRLRIGWSIDDALTIPVRVKKKSS